MPILLVSAENKIAADYIVSELIDNEGTDVHREQSDALDPVWRIVNKYYRADVRVHTRLDGEPLHVDPHLIEGHLIYLTQDECTADVPQRRAAGVSAEVCVVAAHCDHYPPPLHSWTVTHRAELVPLLHPPPPAAGADPQEEDDVGIARVRAALHAHTWRGLVRPGDQPPGPTRLGTVSSSEGSDAEGSGAEGSDAEGSEAEEWVWAAAWACAREAGAAPRQLRVARAERLMRALRLL